MPIERWVDPSQPQTLQIATWLLYANAVLGLLLGGSILFALGVILGLLGLVASAAAGLGIANERKWGYGLGVVVAALEVVLYVWVAGGIVDLLTSPLLISFLFAGALLALLVHPQSREYQRIWFR
jgi:hypothetical protein